MTLIGFDTSMPPTVACVVPERGPAVATAAPSAERLRGAAAHSQELLPELERLLTEAGLTWDDVHSIAVGIGPGTFTGLRIGVATARALSQALDAPLRPVSSLEALALGAAERAGAGERPLLALIDARRGQVFAALYRVHASEAGSPPRLEALWEPAALEPQELVQRLTTLDRSPVCAGDWALESREELEAAGAAVPPADSGAHAVSAQHLCILAAGVEPVPPERVYPAYLRLPDAEVNKRLAQARGS